MAASATPQPPLVAYHHNATAPVVTLQENDVICEIGNGLADRMQHDGWVETLIQSKLPEKKLVFRNLAFTGDTVTARPRQEGFASPEDYLKLCKADVIFAYFGYNESFAGEGGVAKFKTDLGAMIDQYRGIQFNGKSAPRIVLFSPIAHENLKSPNLPNGAADNVNLALYTAAIQQVAREKKVGFVDLFSNSQAYYALATAPLTLNGVHLLPEGNRQIGEIIAGEVVGQTVIADVSLEPLRQAVLDKNYHWHCRYRAPDGNDIWGSRSGLRYVNNQSNAEVLTQELKMLDVMTANRDPKIWAVAAGRTYTVSDANVPPPLEVISNLDNKTKNTEPPKEPEGWLTPQQSLAKIKVPDGFEITLFADETRFPALANPVQMQVDAKGRLWVACWGTYPKWEPLKPMNDSLLILTDSTGSGVADKAVEFAKVNNPLGFEFWNGGVVVTSMPNLLFLKDTQGNDKADSRFVLFQGIDSADTHHSANNLIYGPDGAIYWQSGIFMHNAFEHPWGPALHTGQAGMYRFDPRCYTISFHADNGPNAHGIAFDYWGYQFSNDGTGGASFQVRPEGNGFRMYPLGRHRVPPRARRRHHFQRQLPPGDAAGFPRPQRHRLPRHQALPTPSRRLQAERQELRARPDLGYSHRRFPPQRRQELPAHQRRVRRRRRTLHFRLVERHHRPHAAQHPRSLPRPRARPDLPPCVQGPPLAEERRHRRPAHPGAARKPQAPGGRRPPADPRRTQRPQFEGGHRRHARSG